jgi:transposase
MEKYQLSKQKLQALRVEHRRQLKVSGRAADRVKAVYLLGSGWSVQSVCEALLLDDNTVRSYFSAYQTGGVAFLLATYYEGSEKKLTDEELRLLDEHLQEVTYQRVKDIVQYVEEMLEVEYTISGMTDLLKALGYSYKKPTKEPKQIDVQAQLAFIKAYKKLRKNLGKDDSIYFMDATHPQHTSLAGYGWIKRGQEKALKTNPIPNRLNINGAINIINLNCVVQYEERLTKETTKDFLEQLRKHQPRGWIHLINDNAGYYDSPEVVAYAESMAIKIHYLPVYSPNLNLIERLWRHFQKIVLYNRYYKTFEEMQAACRHFFETLDEHQAALRTLLTENFQIIGLQKS